MRWLGAKLRTAREVFSNPDSLRRYLCRPGGRLHRANARYTRWLYPAWWRYLLVSLLTAKRRARLARAGRDRYLVRVPCAAGIGDQVVTTWSETFLLAGEHGLTFAHSPFLLNPHSQGVDWEAFLGFGIGEVQAHDLFQRSELRTVYVPPLMLNTPTDRDVLRRLVRDVYPEDGLIFHLGTGLYLNSQLDQAPTMPGVYREKYWRARLSNPMNATRSVDEMHVAVHVRRGDVVSLKDSNVVEWERRWVDAAYYSRLLAALREHLPERSRLHVYSDGTLGEVEELAVFPRTDFHLHEDPRQSFHELVISDVIVVSSSAFAITAGKISTGLKLASRTFDRPDFRLYIPQTSDWAAVEADGTLSPSSIATIRSATKTKKVAVN